jgi:hypothetical protein
MVFIRPRGQLDPQGLRESPRLRSRPLTQEDHSEGSPICCLTPCALPPPKRLFSGSQKLTASRGCFFPAAILL